MSILNTLRAPFYADIAEGKHFGALTKIEASYLQNNVRKNKELPTDPEALNALLSTLPETTDSFTFVFMIDGKTPYTKFMFENDIVYGANSLRRQLNNTETAYPSYLHFFADQVAQGTVFDIWFQKKMNVPTKNGPRNLTNIYFYEPTVSTEEAIQAYIEVTDSDDDTDLLP